MIKNWIRDHVVVWSVHTFFGNDYDATPAKMHVLNRYIDTFTLKNGATFKMSDNSLFTVGECLTEYDYSDIRADDIVLDIGANVGGFSIIASQKAKKIIALEPIFLEELGKNISLNPHSDITVVKGMLGDPQNQEMGSVSFAGSFAQEVPVYSFEKLLQIYKGRIDFLKCDCEGSEIYLDQKLLSPIRRIEIELHDLGNPKIQSLKKFICENWETRLDKDQTGKTEIIHAFRK